MPDYSSFTNFYSEGRQASYVRAHKSPGAILDMLELARPGGDLAIPAVPELLLVQVLGGKSRTRGDSGGGHYDVISEKGDLYLAAPNFAHTINNSANHQVRKLTFPTAQWESVLNEAAGGAFSLESLQFHRGSFRSQAIQSTLRNLWALSDEEGAPSRLLARAAGCEILATLCRLSGASLATTRGGLAPWAKRRCLELMQERLSEDISLDELAAEARLSPFHFARMFKESVGVPPRVHLTRLRLERACDLLETTDLPVTEIAFEVGYSSNQVLARLFLKHRHMTPSDYRRAVRDPVLSSR
jgi:AraC family transcriptional regulator